MVFLHLGGLSSIVIRYFAKLLPNIVALNKAFFLPCAVKVIEPTEFQYSVHLPTQTLRYYINVYI